MILILLEFNFLESTSPTAFTLSFVADSTFYFMSVIIAVFAAKKFKANIALAAMLGASLIHPEFIQAVSKGQSLGIFSLEIYPAMYTNSVIPIILSVWVMNYVESFIRKISPKSLRTMFIPILTMLIMVPQTFVFLSVVLLSAFIPWIVMLGMHVGTVRISLSTIEVSGADCLIMPAFLISNFTQGAACLAVGIKSKSKDVKAFAFSSAFSNIVPGISELGMYGITLHYKTQMWGA